MSFRARRQSALVALAGAALIACGAAAGNPEKSKKKDAPPAPAGAAAMIGDRAITLQEVDAQAASNLFKVRQQEYEARRAALDTMVNEQILDKEAAAKGVTRDKLIEAEVSSKAPDPTPQEIDAFYEQVKGRFGAQPKEQVVPQLAPQLKARKLGEVQQAYLKSLREKHGVRILLDPPRVEVAQDDDAAKGPARAPITIVEFSDYQCPYCSRAEQTVADVLKKYGDKVRLVYRDYPLSFHKDAETAAMASECAKEQGKFWEMHGAMFGNQQKLTAADLVETAAGLGLNKDTFKTCLDSGKYKAEVQKDFQDGAKAGVTGTPTFFVNGIMLVGARPIESFTEVIDAELERVK